MGIMPQALREAIAANIRAERKKKFPGRGGAKRCAEAFGVLPQMWSPWETGKRTPQEYRMSELAKFFGCSVEELRSIKKRPPQAPKEKYDESPPTTLPHVACVESSILWKLDKVYSAQMPDGQRFLLSLNMALSRVE